MMQTAEYTNSGTTPLGRSNLVLAALAIVVLYPEFLMEVLPSALLQNSDHAIVLGTYLVVFARRFARGVIGRTDLWLFVLVGGLIMLSMIGTYSKGASVAIVSTVLLVKLGYLVCIASSLSLGLIARLVPVLAALQVVGLAANLALPGVFQSLGPQAYQWLGEHDIKGFQLNVNRFGVFGVMLFIWYSFIRPNPILACVMLSGVVLSGSRSAAIILVLSVAYFWIRGCSLRANLMFFGAAVVALPAMVLFEGRLDAGIGLLRDSLAGETFYIRSVMLVHGVQLAFQNFPFGTGGGTFGSPLSLGSIVYDVIGIGHFPTVIEGHGINDSGVGSLLGEYGFAGLFLVLLSVGGLFSALFGRRLSRSDLCFIILIFFCGSFFRAMISSYYYGIFLILLAVMLVLHHPRSPKHQTPGHSEK